MHKHAHAPTPTGKHAKGEKMQPLRCEIVADKLRWTWITNLPVRLLIKTKTSKSTESEWKSLAITHSAPAPINSNKFIIC